MSESLFDIFGDHNIRQGLKHPSRQPLSGLIGNENIGKNVIAGPIKPNEPAKKDCLQTNDKPKKTFLSNTGKALQSTPRQVFTPRAVNVGSLIYSDAVNKNGKGFSFEELEFTKPTYKYDNYHTDMFDSLLLPELMVAELHSPPPTPPPVTHRHSMELECSYEDEYFTDDFSNDCILDNDFSDCILEDNLPDIF